jgi:hypothetical protein
MSSSRRIFRRRTFQSSPWTCCATQIAYNWGKSVDHLWADAEQFLAFVDDAYEGDAQEKRRRLSLLAYIAKPYDASDSRYHSSQAPGTQDSCNVEIERKFARRGLVVAGYRFFETEGAKANADQEALLGLATCITKYPCTGNSCGK